MKRFDAEAAKDRLHTGKKVFGIVFGLVFLLVIMINTTGCTKDKNEVQAPDINQDMNIQIEKEPITLGNDGIKAGIAGEEDTTLVASKSSTGKMVSVNVDDIGRVDPFYSDNGLVGATGSGLDLIAPSETITVDPDASNVITTKVSGIMYDAYNPSAILNVEGTDYLVRSGDIFKNYKVLSIGKTSVTVQLGVNIYKAGVGQLFTPDAMNYNVVSNLDKKFGGASNKGRK